MKGQIGILLGRFHWKIAFHIIPIFQTKTDCYTCILSVYKYVCVCIIYTYTDTNLNVQYMIRR